MNPLICPRVDVVITVQNRVRIKTCPFAIRVWPLACGKALILKASELSVPIVEFLRMELV